MSIGASFPMLAAAIIASYAAPHSSTPTQAAFAANSLQTDRMIDVGGYRLHFHVIAGRGVPILFEAGGGDDGSVWNDVAKSVSTATGAPIITYDRAGFGKSETSPSGDVGDHGIVAGVKALEKGLKALGFNGEIFLVGHSYGGFYTTLYAARHPEKVRYAVLIDASSACWFDAAFLRKFRADLPSDLKRLRSQGKLGQYYQSANLPRTVEVMRAHTFPFSVPVTDLVSEHPPFKNDGDVARWRSCHRQFADAAPNRVAITAYGSGHYIYRDDQALVVNTIGRAYARVAGAAGEAER